MERIAHVLAREPRAEIRWYRIEAAAGHDAGTVGSRLRVMPIDLLTDPRGFAGDIAVVSPVANARVDQSCAVQTERPGGTGDDPGLSCQIIQRCIILGVRDQHIGAGQVDATELGAISSRDRPG